MTFEKIATLILAAGFLYKSYCGFIGKSSMRFQNSSPIGVHNEGGRREKLNKNGRYIITFYICLVIGISLILLVVFDVV